MILPVSVRVFAKHVFVIAIFVVYEVTFVVRQGLKIPLPAFISFYILDISYIYFCRYALLPYLGENGWRTIRFFLIPLIIVIYCFAEAGMGNLMWLALIEKPLPPFTIDQVSFYLWRGVYLFSLSLIFFLAYKSVLKEREKRLLENAFLKAQLNPHLLFNTLHFVYSTIEKTSTSGAKAVSLLSDILHNSLQQEKETDKVSIASEVEQVDRYLELNRLVSGNALQIIFTKDIQDNPYEIFIPSLLIVNFLDNTLKHAELSNVDEPAILNLSADKNRIHFYSENLKRKKQSALSHNIGLSNATKRLDNAFGNNYTMRITEDDYWFKLDLMIRL